MIGLPRSTPQLPEHTLGFTLPAMQVFMHALHHESVQIPPIGADTGVETRRMISRHETEKAHSNAMDDALPGYIAVTPRQRLMEDKPYAHRELLEGGVPMNDFQQAAHDMRRMGWLRVRETNSTDVVLVPPTTWHRKYLEYLFVPQRIEDDALKLELLPFIKKALSQFRRSVLYQRATSGSISERTYQSEFVHAVTTVAGNPCFMLPEVRTKSGDGFIDFVIHYRKWLIEFLCEGRRMQDHLDRVTEGGKYKRDLPDYEGIALDFRLGSVPRSNLRRKSEVFIRFYCS